MFWDVIGTVYMMFQDIIKFIVRVYTDFDAIDFMFGGFIIYTTYRILLKPILGSSGSSDMARKKTKKNDVED